MITTIDAGECTRAVEALLLANAPLEGTRIERAAVWDTEPDYKGWIGIYRDSVRCTPRALGAGGGNRRQLVSLVFLVKMSNETSGPDCADALDSLLKRFMNALLNDNSFGGTVDTLDEEIIVQYDSYDKVDSIYTQKAIVLITGIVNVSNYG